MNQIAAWRAFYPDFAIKLWDKKACEALLRDHYPEWIAFYKAAPRRVMCADLIRYLILHHEGGWYFDADCAPRAGHGLPALGNSARFVAFVEQTVSAQAALAAAANEPIRHGRPELQQRIANYAIGSVAKHELWVRVAANIQRRWNTWVAMAANPKQLVRDYDILYITGPDVLTDTIAESPPGDVTIVPKQVADTIVVHKCAGTWRRAKDTNGPTKSTNKSVRCCVQ
jgi:mannosyltransferase OCH1-like enzyme